MSTGLLFPGHMYIAAVDLSDLDVVSSIKLECWTVQQIPKISVALSCKKVNV